MLPLSPLPLHPLPIVGVLVCSTHVTDKVFVRQLLLAGLKLDIEPVNGGVLSQTWQQHVTPGVETRLLFLLDLRNESGEVKLLRVPRGRLVEAVVDYDHL